MAQRNRIQSGGDDVRPLLRLGEITGKVEGEEMNIDKIQNISLSLPEDVIYTNDADFTVLGTSDMDLVKGAVRLERSFGGIVPFHRWDSGASSARLSEHVLVAIFLQSGDTKTSEVICIESLSSASYPSCRRSQACAYIRHIQATQESVIGRFVT